MSLPGGHSGDHDTFFTPAQIEYAESVAIRQITDAIDKDFKALEFEHKPRGAFGIGISMKVTTSAPHRRRVQEVFGFDFADQLDAGAWSTACRVFQKRHLLAHKMGVMDDECVRKANDLDAVAGRRVRVTPQEVANAISLIEVLGQRLFKGLSAP